MMEKGFGTGYKELKMGSYKLLTENKNLLTLIKIRLVKPKTHLALITVKLDLDFEETVADSMLLLDYAARHGIAIDNAIKQNVIKTDLKIKANDNLTEDEHLKFWDSFTTLAKALRPVTSISIKYTLGKSVTGLARRKHQVPIYVILSLIFLVILLIVQIFWVGGKTLAADVSESLNNFYRTQKEIIDKEENIPNKITTAEIDALYLQLREVFARLTSDHQSLHAWNMIWAAKIPFIEPPFTEKPYKTYDAATKANIDLASAKLFLDAAYKYLLPLLYGLLGASFYVLRTISFEIKTWTFTEQSSISYLLRLTLGPLAGLATGLLLIGTLEVSNTGNATAETINLLSKSVAIGPLAAAFVAGYGVELIFSTMDRIISAFTRQGTV